MNKPLKNIELISAIILAAILVSGSLVFLGLMLRQESGENAIIDEEQLTQRIKQEIFSDLQNG
jgi:hypothetical protein